MIKFFIVFLTTALLLVVTGIPALSQQNYPIKKTFSEGSPYATGQLMSGLRIMPIGDSITKGTFGSPDTVAYRKKLYELLEDAGYYPDFVGDYGDPPYEAHYRGGGKIEQFYPPGCDHTNGLCVDSALDNYNPQMVLVHLGTNDMGDYSFPAVPYDDDDLGPPFANTHAGDMAEFISHLLKWNNGERGTSLDYI